MLGTVHHWRGLIAAVIVPPALTAALTNLSGATGHLNLSSQVLLYLVVVVAIARLGGMVAALFAATWASLLLDFYFISPVHTFRIAVANDVIALGAFIVVALTVASVVELSVKQSRRASLASAEAAELEAADKMRTALLNAVSHDLRAPLSATRAAIDTLRDPQFDLPDEDRAELLDAADDSLGRLTRLVENLLDMSRIQAGALKLRLEPVGIEEVVPRALDDVPSAAGRVVWRPGPGGTRAVLADGALLERVVANLVGNAVKHTDSVIELEVGRAEPVRGDEDGPGTGSGVASGFAAGSASGAETGPEAGVESGVIRLRVVDHGPGIPVEHWDRVFRPFQRLGDRDNGAGVGLGLALARGLVEAMNGELRPEETPGGGLTMVVELPAAPRGPDMARVAEEESGP